MPRMRHSVSYTTRAPRPGEINNVHYTFVDKDIFQAMTADRVFLEWAEVHGNYYGTSKNRIEELADAGMDVVLDIDVQGARQIKKDLSTAWGGVYVFILPPSMEVLRRRLVERMSDPDEVIGIRLRNAIAEVREYKNYDYVIVNNIMEDAFKELESIVVSERASVKRIDHEWIHKNFLEEEV